MPFNLTPECTELTEDADDSRTTFKGATKDAMLQALNEPERKPWAPEILPSETETVEILEAGADEHVGLAPDAMAARSTGLLPLPHAATGAVSAAEEHMEASEGLGTGAGAAAGAREAGESNESRAYKSMYACCCRTEFKLTLVTCTAQVTQWE